MKKKNPAKSPKSIDNMCINTIRTLAMDAVQAAKSGHPGAPMGLAAAAYVLWTRVLKHNPKNPDWVNRDRFVLSSGHASMMLYSLLYLCGYDINLRAAAHRYRGRKHRFLHVVGPEGTVRYDRGVLDGRQD